MADNCERHRGPEGFTSPHMDRIMQELPENQSRAGRHKCPYCAYERGERAERRRIAQLLGCHEDELC